MNRTKWHFTVCTLNVRLLSSSSVSVFAWNVSSLPLVSLETMVSEFSDLCLHTLGSWIRGLPKVSFLFLFFSLQNKNCFWYTSCYLKLVGLHWSPEYVAVLQDKWRAPMHNYLQLQPDLKGLESFLWSLQWFYKGITWGSMGSCLSRRSYVRAS